LIGVLIVAGVALFGSRAASAPTSPSTPLTAGQGAPSAPAQNTAVASGLPLPKGLVGNVSTTLALSNVADVTSKFGLKDPAHIAFMHVSGRVGSGSKIDFGSGSDVWVIIETDRTVPILGPNSNPQQPAATYCWSFVSVDFVPRDGLCVSYGSAADVPRLP
jgi:hypothetical protein